MLKNIFFALLILGALLAAQAIQAAEHAPVETLPAEAVPAPALAMPASPPEKSAAPQPASQARPVKDNHVDYRYCLELKTNREIAECRYKKK